MEDVFMIKTVNNTYGEVYVNAPLDRESVDRYLLKVRFYQTPVSLSRSCSLTSSMIQHNNELITCHTFNQEPQTHFTCWATHITPLSVTV